MGGPGTLLYAAHRPGMFRAAASYSGVVRPLYGDFPNGLMGLLRDPARRLGGARPVLPREAAAG